MTHLDFPAAVKELGEAVSYLKSSGASKVGVVGFCMGGALTFAAAQHAGVHAAAPFYGCPDPAICDVSDLVGFGQTFVLGCRFTCRCWQLCWVTFVQRTSSGCPLGC